MATNAYGDDAPPEIEIICENGTARYVFILIQASVSITGTFGIACANGV